ncbi:rRNA maturation RNase YbeY [Rothia terrae]|uniref:rRNA maturation RNase YbeY n=1 Tax=Rothia terrae TaxID=396015 RepID=UPI001446337A|nr:rRNA maturation RNase YbeY [Rothia terrae]MDT0188807.1 rRNA maturation RNase YbeY [Rothia terrae]NKZ33460.1 rRNA maturation RNase YbeY [Rothia terrae]
MATEFEIEEVPATANSFVQQAFSEVSTEELTRLVDFAFNKLYLSPATELSINIVGEQEMERIHLEWMDLPGSTDVMSFPMDEMTEGTADELAEGMLGDIVLCPPVAARQGADAGHSTSDELCLLTVHGILHCLGYDHATAEEEAEMFGIQRSILEEFLGRPAPVETRH